LTQPIDTIRARFAVKPATRYHAILAAAPHGDSAAARGQAVAAVPG
jgi:hypothetical protein